MAKGQWESRVGKLLAPPYFYWSHKCPDSPMYGGQPRVDWVACDLYARFWMIEVKQLSEDRRSINIEREVTTGQQNALDAILDADGVPLLAVGQGTTLYVFTWGRVRWLQQQGVWPRIPLEEASITLTWKGPKSWSNIDNIRMFHRIPKLLPQYRVSVPDPNDPRILSIVDGLSNLSVSTSPSPLTLRQTDFTPTREGTVGGDSVLSSSAPGSRASSSENSLIGGGMS